MENNADKTKILYLITKSNFGGAQLYVFELATNAAKENFEAVVTLGGEGVLKQKLEGKGIKTIQLKTLERNINFVNDFKTFFELLKLFKKESPDIVHINSSKAGILGSLAGRMHNIFRSKKIKIIFTGHGWAFNEKRNFFSKKIILFAHWLTILLSHEVIAVSEKTKNDISGLPFVSDKIDVIYNGIGNVNLKDGFEARQFLGGNISQSVWIGTIAELHKNKGLDFLIKAFGEIANDYPDTALVIIGEGDERNDLEKEISRFDLDGKVYLLGNIPEAKNYLKAFDIFALTSRTEALPYAILEAGLADLPVIASKVGGIPEIIEDMKTGILVKPGNIAQIKDKMKVLLERSDLREQLGSSLKKEILIKFSEEEFFNKTFNLYKKIIN